MVFIAIREHESERNQIAARFLPVHFIDFLLHDSDLSRVIDGFLPALSKAFNVCVDFFKEQTQIDIRTSPLKGLLDKRGSKGTLK